MTKRAKNVPKLTYLQFLKKARSLVIFEIDERGFIRSGSECPLQVVFGHDYYRSNAQRAGLSESVVDSIARAADDPDDPSRYRSMMEHHLLFHVS